MTVRVIQATEEVGDIECTLGEGPMWDDRFDVLRWVDINAGLVHGFSDEDGELDPIDVGQPVGFVVPTGDDRLLAGLRDGFALVGPDGVSLELEIERDRPEMRMNDGKADPAGRVWAGTMRTDEGGADGTLYRLDADWSVTEQLTGLAISNGIGWSPDGATMYFIDSTWKRVDAFDYDLDTGEIEGQRPFVEIPGEEILPDGLTVDEDGCVWVALWGGAAVHRFTPQGELDTIVRVPALQSSSCVFGGPGRRDLYITSAAVNLTEQQLAEYPRSGRVFTCRPGAVGLRTEPFG